jgi:cold shock protein
MSPLGNMMPASFSADREYEMSEGTIKRLTDKGFGFIDTGGGKDMFFHNSAVIGTSFEQLREGQKVSFTEGEGPKGPRAENVRLI